MSVKCLLLGIWLHESGVLAASPDGIVIRGPDCAVHECETLVPELLEVKCPFSKRDVKVHDAAQDEKFFLGMLIHIR